MEYKANKNLSTRWITKTASEYCTKISDGTHDSPKRVEKGKKLITSKNIISCQLDTTRAYCISEIDYAQINKRSKVDKFDVLLSMIGTVGETCFVDTEPDFAIKNVALLKNDDPLKSKWLFLYLCSPKAKKLIKSRLRGTTQQYLTLGEIRNLPITYPSSKIEMNRIVNFLFDINSKIQLNTQINQTLEAMAQALFKSWFVDFEPVKAKVAVRERGGSHAEAERAAMRVISGKSDSELDDMATRDPDDYAQLAHTASLFPDTLVDSELGEIPEGWNILPISKLADKISKGTTPKKGNYNNDEGQNVYFLKVKDITNNHEIDINQVSLIPKIISETELERSILQKGDLLMSIAGTIGRVSVVNDFFDGSNCNQAIAFIRLKEKDKYLNIVRLFLTHPSYKDIFLSKVVQGVQANISLSTISETKIIIPDNDIIYILNNILSKLYNEKEILFQQNQTLATLRDTLLPKLLSGELDVSHLLTEEDA